MAAVGVLSRLRLAGVVAILLGVSLGQPAGAHDPPRGPQGPYRGRVLEAGTGRPIAGGGVFIVWSDSDESGARAPFAYREAQTDAQGDFSIDAPIIEQRLPPRALEPQFWVYKPGYELYPDRDVRPDGAPATQLTRPGAVVQLIGARTDAQRVEALNEFVAVINRYAPTGGSVLLGLIEGERKRLTQSVPDEQIAVMPPTPSPGKTVRGPCDIHPANPAPLPPAKPRTVPQPGTYNPFEGRRAPYYGRVVDAETGSPLAGAAVVASWPRRFVFPFGATSQFYDACEVMTDSDGRFVLDGRAIEARGRSQNIEPPWFSVFYPGYSSFPPRKVVSGRPFIEGDREAFHDVTIGLVKITTRQERIEALHGATPALPPPPEKTPRLTEMIEKEYIDLGIRRER